MIFKFVFNLGRRASFVVPFLRPRDCYQTGSRSQYARTADTSSNCDLAADDEWTLRLENDRDIGATVFLSQHKGFSGRMRHRYSDFIVNEITSQKETVRLTNLGRCQKNSQNFFRVVPHLPKELSNPLFNAFEGKVLNETEINVSALDDNEVDDLCETLKRVAFNLDVRKMSNAIGRAIVLSGGTDNCYTHFTLYKENISQLTAIESIVRALQLKKGDISHCGIKDKRAVTCQKMSIRNVEADKLLDLNHYMKHIKIGGVYYDSKPVRLGDLYGNHFTILLRDVDGSDDTINTAMENFSREGFINYYGIQRFGSAGSPTLLIGKKILARQWRSAIETIIKPTKNKVAEDVLKCRTLWWETRDAEKALKCLHMKRSQLAYLLKGLVAHNNDYEKALSCYSTDLIRFYMYSYSSYVWNHIVSRRIEELGPSPIVGDLVIPSDVVKPLKEHDPRLQVVTPEMLDRREVTMYNVVLPLPGHNMRLPQNIVGEWYKEFLTKDGLTISNFHSERALYNIAVSYRHMLSRAEDVSWSVVNYNNVNELLLETDYSKYIGLIPLARSEGNRRALKMQFSLVSASYATSAIREIVQKCISEMTTIE